MPVTRRARDGHTKSDANSVSTHTPIRIEQLMSQPVVSCRDTDSLRTAAGLMWEHDCGSVPVTDDEGHLVGVITDRDICMATYLQGKTLQAISVRDVMAKQVYACTTAETLEAAERLMSSKQIRRVPVVDAEQHPVGMLSINDIARHGISGQSNGIDRELLETMAAICQPRARIIERKQA